MTKYQNFILNPFFVWLKNFSSYRLYWHICVHVYCHLNPCTSILRSLILQKEIGWIKKRIFISVLFKWFILIRITKLVTWIQNQDKHLFVITFDLIYNLYKCEQWKQWIKKEMTKQNVFVFGHIYLLLKMITTNKIKYPPNYISFYRWRSYISQ